MPKFTVGGGGEGDFEELPAMRDVIFTLMEVEVLPAEGVFGDRIKFPFRIDEVEEEEHEQYIGREHWERPNMPKGKGGKLSPNSNLSKILEGLSGGEFEPDQEVDTDPFEGKQFIGDLKRRTKKKNIGTEAAPKFIPDPEGAKKTVLENLRPYRPKKNRAQAQAPVQQNAVWDDEDED